MPILVHLCYLLCFECPLFKTDKCPFMASHKSRAKNLKLLQLADPILVHLYDFRVSRKSILLKQHSFLLFQIKRFTGLHAHSVVEKILLILIKSFKKSSEYLEKCIIIKLKTRYTIIFSSIKENILELHCSQWTVTIF